MIPLEMAERTPAPDGRPAAEQPAWRRAFPIDVPQEQYVARRDFTRFMMLTSAACAAGQVCLGLGSLFRRKPGPLPAQAICHVDEIAVGGARPFLYPDAGGPCLLLRPAEGTFLAFGQKCTHLGCAVMPDAEAGRLRCPCHHGLFDAASGRPVAGPARRPLPRVALENRDGVLFAVGMEESPV